jgi:hypothetical protein
MDLETAVVVAGGRISSPADLCDAIPMDELVYVESWIPYFQDITNALSEGATTERISIVLTRSPSLAFRIRPLDDGSFVLLAPIGFIVRVRLLATLLLSYPDRDHRIRVISSLLDDYEEGEWELPDRLLPIFGELVDDGDHWRLLAELAAEWVPDSELNFLLREVTWFAMTYVLMHEVSHALRGHTGALLKFQKEELALASSLGHKDFRRGLELDADVNAAAMLLYMTGLQLDQLQVSEYRQNWAHAFEWLGFAVTLIFGMYDTRRKALNLYAERSYPHPVIRHSLFVHAATSYVSTEKAEWLGDWKQYEYVGWQRCVYAFWRLDEDCFAGKFSVSPQGRCSPVTALNYNISDKPFNDAQVEREAELHEYVQRLLNSWRQSGDNL